MIWSALFIINIVQGLFLISIFTIKRSSNTLAARLLSALILLMILANFGYLVIRTDLKEYVPQTLGATYGIIFLYGPLFYLYSKSVTDNNFKWERRYWLHFIPYFLQFLYNIPFFFYDKSIWTNFINRYLTGNLPFITYVKVLFALQNVHLLTYLVIIFLWIRKAKHDYSSVQYITSVPARITWLKTMAYCFSILALTIFTLYIYILIIGKYNPVTNYIYTLITSGIIYFIAFKAVLNLELIMPDFAQKYRSYMEFSGDEGEKYLQRLKFFMEEEKIFTNQELKLKALAEKIELPQHQLSKLINEKFGKSFSDYVNEYRVKEFINRVNQNNNENYTLYGIALEVGFNSKSSFNSAFKKITGKTPSEYKITS
ncbi:MAG: helix-turn-helix domain-containing protein [Bacteroidota bacterium]